MTEEEYWAGLRIDGWGRETVSDESTDANYNDVTPKQHALHEAEALITGPRQSRYGAPNQNFTDTAELWSTYLGQTVTPVQVGVMMTLLKVARLKNDDTHEDSFLDAIGYLACAYECSQEEE